MSEESIEELCREKIRVDFEVFKKRKMKAKYGIDAKINTEKMSEIEEKLKGYSLPENEMLKDMYKRHAEELIQEVHDGNFSARKKCNYCKRFFQNYEENKAILPCPKMKAYQKMLDIDREKLTDDEYREIFDGQFRCGKLYLPNIDQEEIDYEMVADEKEQLEAIDEWLEMAIFELDNL